MIERLRYVCEKCGAEYVEQENAEACEARHVPIARVTEVSYPMFGSVNTINYPNLISVEMEDGAVFTYQRTQERGC